VTRARIVRSDAGDSAEEWTYTIDLSERGVLLRRHPAFDELERFTLELMFGDDPQPIAAHAEIVRRVDGAVGVAFEPSSAEAATRLGEYLMGIRHRRRAAAGD
jgi:hypothetical protein